MLNFSVGPVQSYKYLLEIGGQDTPYFRTNDFSNVMLRNEQLLMKLLEAPTDSRVCFLTGSGTAAMEASVMSVCSSADRALVVNGGTFGKRFCDLLALHEIPYDEVILERGAALKAADLEPYDGGRYTVFFVNIHETSTCILYDKDLIADFCRRNNLLLVVDAISSFMADSLSMLELGASVVIVGSQKALACQPGISAIALAPRAIERIKLSRSKCMYLDLKAMLEDGTRGQTPFTPAVTILLQIATRLERINEVGIDWEVRRVASLAHRFREGCHGMPLDLRLCSPSNAATYVCTGRASARRIVEMLQDEYSIWVCPNGGEFADSSFRVGHIGCLTEDDVDELLNALHELEDRGFMESKHVGGAWSK